MITVLQKERLLMLRDLILINADHYRHDTFKSADGSSMCALGLAVEHKELFPGLGLNFSVTESEGTFQRLGYNVVNHFGDFCPREAELYFGDGSWKIFGLYGYKMDSRYPTAAEVAAQINEFIEEQQCTARQHVECSPAMALDVKN